MFKSKLGIVLAVLLVMVSSRNMDLQPNNNQTAKHVHTFLQRFLAGSADSIIKGRAFKQNSAPTTATTSDRSLEKLQAKTSSKSEDESSTTVWQVEKAVPDLTEEGNLVFVDTEEESKSEEAAQPLYITPKTSQHRDSEEGQSNSGNLEPGAELDVVTSLHKNEIELDTVLEKPAGIDRSMIVESSYEPSHYIQDSVPFVDSPPLREKEYFTAKMGVRPSLDIKSAYFLRPPADSVGHGVSYTQLEYQDPRYPFKTKEKGVYSSIVGGLAGVLAFLLSKKVLVAAVVIGLLLTFGITGTTPYQLMQNFMQYQKLHHDMVMNVTMRTADGMTGVVSHDLSVGADMDKGVGTFSAKTTLDSTAAQIFMFFDKVAYKMMEPVLEALHTFFKPQVEPVKVSADSEHKYKQKIIP